MYIFLPEALLATASDIQGTVAFKKNIEIPPYVATPILPPPPTPKKCVWREKER